MKNIIAVLYSHLLTFSPSYLLTFSPSELLTFSPSHLLTFRFHVPDFQFHRDLPVPDIEARGEHRGKMRAVPHLRTEKVGAVERDSAEGHAVPLPEPEFQVVVAHNA